MNNPFEAISQQMNQAKAAYDQTMSGLQSQLQAIRHQAASLYPNPYSAMNPYAAGQMAQMQQMQQAPQPQPAQAGQPQPMQPQEPEEHPQYVKQMEVLNGIRDAILQTNTLLESLAKAQPKSEKTEEPISVKPSKTKENESNKALNI